VVAWLTGSALVSIDEVALRRALLVLGWVTVFGRANRLKIKSLYWHIASRRLDYILNI